MPPVMNILDQEIILNFFHSHYELFISSVFLTTFALTYYLIPKVLWVSREKGLMADVNERSAHITPIPAFGGVAFYICIILVLSVLQSMRLTFVGNHLIAAITLLFMVGLKDDLVVSSARIKLLGQITAAIFIIFSPELMLTSLHGFLGIYEIHPLTSIFLKGFIVIALINSFNLIDGIDGLGAVTGIVIAGTFSWVFYLTNQPYYVMVAICVVGILTGFLRYNLSEGRKKMFMGDSGSLVVGLLLAFLTIRYLGMEPNVSMMTSGYLPENRLLFLACVLFIPVFDTLRVILIRIANGKSPFSADRNHIHNVLVDLGLSHRKASAFFGLLNLIVITIYFIFSDKLGHEWLLLVVGVLYLAGLGLFAILKSLGKLQQKIPNLIKFSGNRSKSPI